MWRSAPPISKSEKLLLSQDFLSSTHGTIDCATCHGGQSPGDMASAYAGLVKDPSLNGEACVGCHEEIVQHYATSLHSTLQGQVALWRPGLSLALWRGDWPR